MTMDDKNKYIEKYINDMALEINKQFGKEIIDEDKISKALDNFKDSKNDLDKEIIPEIKQLAKQEINNYLFFQDKINEMVNKYQEEQLDDVATLNLNTKKNGIYLSQQQIDLLMITELKSKKDLKNFVENICGQFPNMSITDIIPDFDNLTEDKLEQAKKTLYQEYQKSLISYLDNAIKSDKEKAEIKLKKVGINGQELTWCLKQVENGKIAETFNYLGHKYGKDFISKINYLMIDDFENIKAVSYEEMKSLSELISNDETIDTIIIATSKFDNIMYPSINGKEFDPYLTNKALNYCISHNKHMRYHALFDQTYVENLLKQGKGLKDHDQILLELKEYVKKSFEYIEKNNQELSDGTMAINTIEIFNELVEKNKKDKSSPYDMVFSKYFGITIYELISIFDNIPKSDGISFMYNETSLTESPKKREMVEKVLFQIDRKKPNLIDSFGDQMHLSDEDVMSEEGIKNLEETARMINRIQKGQVYVDGQLQNITPKNTECTEHDFHFTKSFLDKIDKLKQSNLLWPLKRVMQSLISNIYLENGVKFKRSTYWSLFGKNDHNIVRSNISIQEENIKRKKDGLPLKPLIETMLAGLVLDGKNFHNIKLSKKILII